MIKKFKCIACGKKFDADDKDAAVCPKCHSDNITPVKPEYLKHIGFGLVLLVSIGAGMLVTKQCKSDMDHRGGIDLVPGTETSAEVNSEDSLISKYDIDPELLKAIEIQSNKPVYDKKSKTYSLSVTAKNTPKGAKVKYELCEDYNPKNNIKKVLMTSENGKFVGISPSKKDYHTYYVVASVIGSDGQAQIIDREIEGFDEVKPVVNRITKEQLQGMINHRDPALQGGDPRISNSVVFVTKGNGEADSFQEVFNNIDFNIWNDVTVVSVDYDSDNRVSKVVLSVKVVDN
jgi:DNA-directed RNA polymerase subunit RPC12/RpoP